MAQDTTPAVVIHQGDGKNQIFSVPFDKGNYGTIRVAFVRRGLTEYEYNPTTYTVDGHLYAWDLGGDPKQYRYTKSDDSRVYDANNVVIEGIIIESMFDSSIRFSDGVIGYRAHAKDIISYALVEWLGTPLTSDDWICIVRDTKTGQPYTYSNNQKHIEYALDNLSRQIQELKAQVTSALKVDPTYLQDPNKMNPIDWLNTIVRSNDRTARNLKYHDMWLEYSTENPDLPEEEKEWVRLLNTVNITTLREYHDEGTGQSRPQYSMDGGEHWKEMWPLELIQNLQDQLADLLGKLKDIKAEDVLYTNEQYPDVGNLQDAMDLLLYVEPKVTLSGGGTYEIGTTRSKTDLSWTWNKKIESQSLNQGIGELESTVRKYTYEVPITSNTTFTITGTDGKTTKSASTSVTFQPSRYWGVSTKTSLTDADILGLSSELSTTRTQSRTFNCSGGKYFYLVIRTDYCSGIKFKVGGLSFSDMIVETRSVVNAQGYSQKIGRAHV